MAWEREAGDKTHKGVHFAKEVWTKEIKRLRNDVVRDELKELLTGVQLSFFEDRLIQPPEQTHDELQAAIDQIHASVLNPSQQAQEYEQSIQQKAALRQLKWAFDCWCAVWFWQGDQLDVAPTPMRFVDPPPETQAAVERLGREYQFFHWELEFPDVFKGEGTGFDGVVGNPPWETLQPNSKEFFSNIDPLYRTYGKQEALEYQQSYFAADPNVEESWLTYCAQFKAIANWCKYVSYPFGDNEEVGSKFTLSRKKAESDLLQNEWRTKRQTHKSYADRRHPFRYQGEGKPYTYKMFTELAHSLLCDGGRLSLITPSGIYTDKGSANLRKLFLNHCEWTHLYAFQNERFVFGNIHHSFKMVVLTINKVGQTDTIATRFRLGPGDSPEAQELETDIPNDLNYLSVPAQQIKRFSPNTGALLEIRTEQDLKILEKMYQNGVFLGDRSAQGWGIHYRQGDFNMTSDSKLFPPRPKWEEKGYRPDEYGHWLKGNWQPYKGEPSILKRPEGLVLSVDGEWAIAVNEVEDVALPLYEGRMVGQFDFSEKGWVSGTGRKAVWREISSTDKVLEPQFLMANSMFSESESPQGTKIGFLAISSASNTRSMICTNLYKSPCGNAVPTLEISDSYSKGLWLTGVFNSYFYDFTLRNRFGGVNLNFFVVEETPVVKPELFQSFSQIAIQIAGLCWNSSRFASAWLKVASEFARQHLWKQLWAVTPHERLRLRCIVEAVVAKLYGLSLDEGSWILKECDHPIKKVCDKPFSRTLEPKGFWRVDKEKDPELRHTVLSLIAFHHLKQIGLEAFLDLNDGEGWMLPETLRLADYGLGHDDRAKEHQPVAARLGDRFLPWQLEGTPEESWEECERHAENLRRLLGNQPSEIDPPPSTPGSQSLNCDQQLTLLPNDTEQLNLFNLPDPE